MLVRSLIWTASTTSGHRAEVHVTVHRGETRIRIEERCGERAGGLFGGVPAPPYLTVADAQTAGAVTVNYGMFINNIIAFVIVAFAVFMLVKSINRLRRQEQEAPRSPTDKPCPFCATTIPLKATRCPHCTSPLETATG